MSGSFHLSELCSQLADRAKSLESKSVITEIQIHVLCYIFHRCGKGGTFLRASAVSLFILKITQRVLLEKGVLL